MKRDELRQVKNAKLKEEGITNLRKPALRRAPATADAAAKPKAAQAPLPKASAEATSIATRTNPAPLVAANRLHKLATPPQPLATSTPPQAAATANDPKRKRMEGNTSPEGAKVPKTNLPQRPPATPPEPVEPQAVDPKAAPKPRAAANPPVRGPWVEYVGPEAPPLMTMTMRWEANRQALLGDDTR